ncbi:MAG TPA: isoprenylcysteine carboxylmethyltransferase family protein [Streptosporangiaceae bacterium]|nr:isoprenylcysteine carboxylmethyltransferase family protein [Streptosporangiaceae bacterium]
MHIIAPLREGTSWRGRLGLGHAISSPRLGTLGRVAVNLAGAASAALFARASLAFYLQTHRPIGAAFFAEQAWFVTAFLIRRPARSSAESTGPWLLAAGGTFGGLLLRPSGGHPAWGVTAGLACQLFGLALAVTALVYLGRSFGLVAADRGLVTRGPYALVRHPVYAAYIVIEAGYVLQSVSPRNAVVVAFATCCNIGRIRAEERLLAATAGYAEYAARVPWRLLPGVW